MNSRERVFAAITGSTADRRAVGPVLCLYGAQLTGCPLERFFSDPREYALGQAAVRQEFAPDILFGPFAFAKIGAAFGSEIRQLKEAAPNVRRGAVATAAELLRLPLPNFTTHPHLTYFSEAIRHLVVEFGNELPVAAVLPSPTDLPALIFGMDAWMEMILFDREAAFQAAAHIADFLVAFANHLFALGADFAVMPCAFGSPAVVTRELAQTFSQPVMRATLARLSKPVVFHHGGAPLLPYLDLFADLPNLAGVAMDHTDDLSRARAVLGLQRLLLGGIAGPGLAGQTASAVTAQCRVVLQERYSDPHFILYTSGPDVPLHTPPENIRALLQSVVENG